MTRTKLCRSLAVALAAVVAVPGAGAQEPVKPGPEHAHLKKLAFELRREDPAGLTEAAAAAPQPARQALRRLDAGR